MMNNLEHDLFPFLLREKCIIYNTILKIYTNRTMVKYVGAMKTSFDIMAVTFTAAQIVLYSVFLTYVWRQFLLHSF